MENASKALIIAGAILISILIISLGVLVFNKFGGQAKEAANMDEQEIANFNSQLTPYIGKSISGSQVNALIQKVIAIDSSAVSSKDTSKKVKITFKDTAGNSCAIYVKDDGSEVEGMSNGKRVKTGSGMFYSVTAQYSDSGLINEINVN